MRRRDHILIDWLVPIVLLIGLTIPFWATGLDMAIERRFYVAGEGWPQGGEPPWSWLYQYGPVPAWILSLSALFMLVASRWNRAFTPHRRKALFLVLVMAVGPGLVVNEVFKQHWGRPRPEDVVEFSGDRAYVPVWQKSAPQNGNSFSSGHASTGFYLLAPYFYLRTRRGSRKWAAASLAIGLVYGGVVGLARMVQGAHFASDVLWSGGFVYLTGLALFYILRLDHYATAGVEASRPTTENVEMIDALNRTFGVDGHVTFEAGEGGLPRANIANALASAEVYLHGAHVTAFQPRGAAPVLWMSALAEFRPEKAIRGGVPIAWPWFGPHPTDAAKPQHGFARVSEWKVIGTSGLPDGGTELRLALGSHAATLSLWPHAFELELKVAVGERLHIELTTRNTGSESVEVGGALHSYFHVGDVGQVTIDGLDGREYIDQVDGRRIKSQNGPLAISGEVDRIYFETPDECIIDDPLLRRRIRVAKQGSRATVVWNPWVYKARRMADFPDEGYRTMVCIEAANAERDVRRLQPGDEHTLSQIISVETL